MPQDMRKYAWLIIPLLVALLVGIVLGIALPQNSITMALPVLLGWLFLPISLAALFNGNYVDYVTHVPWWLVRLVMLSYPLAALTASACTYWMLHGVWKRGQALLCVVLLACISTLACILVSMLAPSFNSNGTMAATPGLVLPVWANLLFSAVLGWGIGCLIPKRQV